MLNCAQDEYTLNTVHELNIDSVGSVERSRRYCLSPMELDISHMYMKEYDGSQKVTKKTLSSGVKRAELLTKLYEDETAASKKRTVDLTKQAQEGTSRKTKRKATPGVSLRPPLPTQETTEHEDIRTRTRARSRTSTRTKARTRTSGHPDISA